MIRDKIAEIKIAKIIYDELCYMYCDNCRYNSEIDEDEPNYGCDDCHRKYNGWGISMAEANRLAEMAIEALSEQKTGKWIKSNLLPNGWHCSHCDSPVMTDDIEEMLYCPNCGYPMKGGAE